MHGESAFAAWRSLQLSSEGGHPFAHSEQPNAGCRGGVRRGRSVVIDSDAESVTAVIDPNRRDRGDRVPVDVGERFLNDPIGSSIDSGRQARPLSLDRQMCLQARALSLAEQSREVVEPGR